MKPFQRVMVDDLEQAVRHNRPLLQVVIGPRQVGKTTAVQQLLERLQRPSHVASADTALPPGPEWIESHWSVATSLPTGAETPAILVLDEIQKVRGWRVWPAASCFTDVLIGVGRNAARLSDGTSTAGCFLGDTRERLPLPMMKRCGSDMSRTVWWNPRLRGTFSNFGGTWATPWKQSEAYPVELRLDSCVVSLVVCGSAP